MRISDWSSDVCSSDLFDAVLNMEVVEHVADVGAFLRASADLVRPGGVMILATLNRTPKAFLMAIVGAEYLLRWLPRGTHDWRRFLRPSELAHAMRGTGLQIEELGRAHARTQGTNAKS